MIVRIHCNENIECCLERYLSIYKVKQSTIGDSEQTVIPLQLLILNINILLNLQFLMQTRTQLLRDNT